MINDSFLGHQLEREGEQDQKDQSGQEDLLVRTRKGIPLLIPRLVKRTGKKKYI